MSNITKKQETAVTTPADILAMFNPMDNMEAVETPRLPQIKVASETAQFELPNGDYVKEFDGIVIDARRNNVYWGEDEDQEIPLCNSLDGQNPDLDMMQDEVHEKNPANWDKKCKTCALNKFKSDSEGKGKACTNQIRLHVVKDWKPLPFRLTLSPASIRRWEDYVTILTQENLPFPALLTQFSLEKIEDGKMKYSKIVLNYKRGEGNAPEYITMEQAQEIVRMRENLADQMANESILKEEAATETVADPY